MEGSQRSKSFDMRNTLQMVASRRASR